MLKYKLKCWKVRDGMPTTFCEETGILFFSELFFKWKDSVPAQEREKAHNSSWEDFVSKPWNLHISTVKSYATKQRTLIYYEILFCFVVAFYIYVHIQMKSLKQDNRSSLRTADVSSSRNVPWPQRRWARRSVSLSQAVNVRDTLIFVKSNSVRKSSSSV